MFKILSLIAGIQPVGKVALRTERLSSNPCEIARIDCYGRWSIEVVRKGLHKTIQKKIYAGTIMDDVSAFVQR